MNTNQEDLYEVLENKVMQNLKWSMLFFVFDYMANQLEEKLKENKNSKIESFRKHFFKNWKKHACNNMIKKDLETINSILNSPQNSFLPILKNSNDELESTEMYQEIYNNIVKKAEDFYFHNISEIKNNEEDNT